MQDGTTGDMVFKVAELIAFISASVTLEPGDLIATGTPSGVGVFREPPVWLVPGDVVRVEVERIGSVTNPIVDADGNVPRRVPGRAAARRPCRRGRRRLRRRTPSARAERRRQRCSPWSRPSKGRAWSSGTCPTRRSGSTTS